MNENNSIPNVKLIIIIVQNRIRLTVENKNHITDTANKK